MRTGSERPGPAPERPGPASEEPGGGRTYGQTYVHTDGRTDVQIPPVLQDFVSFGSRRSRCPKIKKEPQENMVNSSDFSFYFRKSLHSASIFVEMTDRSQSGYLYDL